MRESGAVDRKPHELIIEELGCTHRWNTKTKKGRPINYCLDCGVARYSDHRFGMESSPPYTLIKNKKKGSSSQFIWDEKPL